MKDSYAFYKDKLSGEYKEVFAKTEMYVLSQNADNDTTEERLGELLDVFLSAEESGRPVGKIVGNDLEGFCRSVCSDFSLKNRLLNFADYFKVIAWVLVFSLFTNLICNINSLLHGEALDLWNEGGDFLFGYFASAFVSWAIMTAVNALTCRLMFRSKSFSAKKLTAIGVTTSLSTFLIVYLILINLNISVRFYCPSWVILICAAGYLLFYYLAIKKRSKQRKIKFTDLVNEEMRKDFPEEMEKKLEKARRKSLEKGNGELSVEEFLDKEEKECAKEEKLKSLYYGTPPVLTLLLILNIYFTDGFESVIDVILFFVICLVVEYLIMVGMWRIVESGITQRREWIAKKREEIKREADNG